MKKLFFIFVLILFVSGELIHSQTEIPKIKQRVTDLAGFLTSAEIESLEKILKNYEDTTSNQIVILTIPKLEGFEIEEYAAEVIKQNGIGQKDKNNGLLILAVKESRKVKIEVGYGLEPVVTDAISGQIIRNDILPNFKREMYFQGFINAIEDIQKAIGGEFVLDKKSKDGLNKIPSFLWIIIFVILAILSRFTRRRRVGGWTYYGGGWSSGGSSGGFGGGGFSGGGGMSGGGGASGSW